MKLFWHFLKIWLKILLFNIFYPLIMFMRIYLYCIFWILFLRFLYLNLNPLFRLVSLRHFDFVFYDSTFWLFPTFSVDAWIPFFFFIFKLTKKIQISLSLSWASLSCKKSISHELTFLNRKRFLSQKIKRRYLGQFLQFFSTASNGLNNAGDQRASIFHSIGFS